MVAVRPMPGAARAGVLLAPVAIAAGWREPRLDRLPWLGALASLPVLLAWALPPWQPTGEAITAGDAVEAVLPGDRAPEAIRPLLHTAAGMAGLFAAAGLLLERRMVRPLPWAGLVAAVPVLALATTYAQVAPFQPDRVWAGAALALAAGPVGAAALARRETGRDGLRRAGVHAAGATAALAHRPRPPAAGRAARAGSAGRGQKRNEALIEPKVWVPRWP